MESEDGLQGRLNTNLINLEGGNSAQITVNDIVVPPNLKSGMKTVFSIIVRKEDYRRKKREDPPNYNQGVGGSNYNQGGSIGGSSSVGGSSSYNPGYNQGGSIGGSSSVGGGGGSYNPGYNQGGSIGGSDYNQGGSYNPGYNQGGSIGGSDYNQGGGGNNNYNGGNVNWNNDPGYNDPSHKREVRSTVEFHVTDEYEEDDTEPWYAKEYGADSEDETCTNGPGEAGCDMEWWWVKFRIQDEESGLHLVDVLPGGKETYQSQVYYRY